MTIEKTGPGGIGNVYGVRTTNTPTKISSTSPKDIYNGFDANAAATIVTDASGKAVGIAGGDGEFLNLTKTKIARLIKQANVSNLFKNPIPSTPITVTSTTTDPALGNTYSLVSLIGANSSLFKIYGGIEKNVSGNWGVVSASSGADGVGSGTPKQNLTVAAAVEFMTNAPSCSIRMWPNGAAQSYRVAVDGVYQADTQVTTTAVTYITTGIGAVPMPSGAKRVRFEWQQSGGNIAALLTNISVPTGYEIYAPVDDESVEALFIGDSYFSTGASGTYAHKQLPAVVAQKLGWDYTASAIGGTGYVTTGSNSAYGSVGRIADYAIKQYDRVVILGSVNDPVGAVGSANYLSVKAAALAAWRAIRGVQPNAKIYIFGVPTTVSLTNANAVLGEAALQAAFDEWGDANSEFKPVSTGSSWITTSNAANYIDADNTHLSKYVGINYFADRMVQSIKSSP